MASDGKLYQIICAEYDAKKHDHTETELLVGRKNTEKRDINFYKHIDKCLKIMKKRRDGLNRAGHDSANEEKIICELEKLKKDREN